MKEKERFQLKLCHNNNYYFGMLENLGVPHSEKIRQLKEQLHHLEEEEEENEKDNEKYHNEYEELLAKQPILIHRAITDMLNLKMDTIRQTSVENIPAILKYFDGKSPTQKKQNLIRFLMECPAYKTTDIKLMQHRLERLRRAAQAAQDVGMDEDGFFSFIKSRGFLIE